MLASATAWWAPKAGNAAHEYEDAFALEAAALRFAVADGASETSFARQWAELLVDRFVHEPPVGGSRARHEPGIVRGVRGPPARERSAAQRRHHPGADRGRCVSWPTMSDYQEAVQNPANCFSDPDLKKGTPTLNALGLPQPVTGGFCSVYQITSSKTRWAVRCFLHNIKDIRDRYHQISKYLKSQRLKQMVGFGYVPEGIRVRGAWYPVLRMEWVDGHNLDRWVENHLKDPRALRKLAERWEELMDQLEKAKIGHCDLQHGNVLVDGSGSLKLIDYDGMYVPPLRGRGSHEKGHPAYRHPEREGKDFDEAVDRFSALVIQASLLALAEKPELWKKYNEEDNLIFKRTDFQSPDSAPVFKDLDKMGGSVAALSNALREACKGRVGKSPRLRDLKNGKAGAPAPIPLPVPPPQPARPASAPSSKAATQPVAAGAAAASRPAAPPPAAKVIPFPAAASGGKSKQKSRRAKSQRAKSQRA